MKIDDPSLLKDSPTHIDFLIEPCCVGEKFENKKQEGNFGMFSNTDERDGIIIRSFSRFEIIPIVKCAAGSHSLLIITSPITSFYHVAILHLSLMHGPRVILDRFWLYASGERRTHTFHVKVPWNSGNNTQCETHKHDDETIYRQVQIWW